MNISGTNLGASFSDILQVRLVSVAGNINESCDHTREEEMYIAGRQIVCETMKIDEIGKYMMNVHINREPNVAIVGVEFFVEKPQLSGVDPQFGPKSGGIDVTVSGGNLTIGNTKETRVELNGVDCTIRE